MELIEKLAAYRVSQGLSQMALAEKLSVSFFTVNKWFNGKAKPRPVQEYRIKELLGETKVSNIDLKLADIKATIGNRRSVNTIRDERAEYKLISQKHSKVDSESVPYGVSTKYINSIKLIRDIETGEEEIEITYRSLSESGTTRTERISGKDLAKILDIINSK